MGIESSAESPYGSEALMVSKQLGPAYRTVKLVADNLPALVALNANTANIIAVAASFPATVAAIDADAVAANASKNAAAVSAGNAAASANSIGGAVTTSVNAATSAAISAVAAELGETNAEAAAAQAAASALIALNIAGGNFLPLTGGVVTGPVTFSGALTVQDTVYSAGWNGSSLAASRNAVYDAMEILRADKVSTSGYGIANGFAPLGADAKIPVGFLPDAVLGALKFQGTWNSTTNVPAIPAAAAGNKGHYYVVAVAGATAIDAESDWNIGDWIISSGVTWSKIDNTDKVSSVNGLFGAVVLNKMHIGLPLADNTADADKPLSIADVAALGLKSPIAPRKQTAAANAITPASTNDLVSRTVTAAVTINNPTGVFADGQGFVIRLKSAAAHPIVFGVKYRPVGDPLSTITVAGKMLYIPVMYIEEDDKFDVFPAQQEA